MGYDVHITRKEDWSEEHGLEITLDEWLSIVEADPEMRRDDMAEATTSTGDTVRYENSGLAVWTAYSKANTGQTAWFDFQSGSLVVKNPDREMLKKMWSIAERLSAKVQGDEGETYGRDGEQIP